jgi:hypothetical protein
MPAGTTIASRAMGSATQRATLLDAATVPAGVRWVGVNVSSCVSINDLTIRMGWIAGLAVVGLVLAGWRKTARAQPKSHRDPFTAPRRVPHELVHVPTEPYRPANPVRRLWAVAASGGLAVVIGAIIATVTAFALAVVVTTLTDLLKQ